MASPSKNTVTEHVYDGTWKRWRFEYIVNKVTCRLCTDFEPFPACL